MTKILDMTCPTPSNDELNTLQTNNIVMTINKVPDSTFKLKAVSIPSLELDYSEVSSSSRSTPFAGTKLTYGRLVCTFDVNANMSNYMLFFNWLKALGKPDNPSQFMNIPEQMFMRDRYEMPYDQRLHDMLRNGDDNEAYGRSDATIFITGDKASKLVVAEVTFEDVYPVSLSDIEFIINASEPSYAQVSVSFAYDKFDIKINDIRQIADFDVE